MVVEQGQQYNIGEKPTVSYTALLTVTLIAVQGHQNRDKRHCEQAGL